MTRLLPTIILTCLATTSHAAQVPGDINFILDASPNNHAYKFRLIVNDTTITFPTKCITPNTGLSDSLTYGSIGQANARLAIQGADCEQNQDNWVTINGVWDHSSNYWYDVYINMIDGSFHF